MKAPEGPLNTSAITAQNLCPEDGSVGLIRNVLHERSNFQLVSLQEYSVFRASWVKINDYIKETESYHWIFFFFFPETLLLAGTHRQKNHLPWILAICCSWLTWQGQASFWARCHQWPPWQSKLTEACGVLNGEECFLKGKRVLPTFSLCWHEKLALIKIH